ncbi:MAG: AtpZ/AtpI family protein [Anaerolineales bacterium]|jgi:F0F1-type ATP synthase assembly protein I|nr:AtpZ/AtpI family protein [Anaerolineales bacterium]MCK4977369.1 AtpZ/AtpI family protein [Anaerolineales bacterium]
MSPSSNQPEKNRAQYAFNLTLAVVAGQVGCLTLLIVVGALFGGLWLDSRFQTKPMITVGLMVLSVPITLVVMFWVVRTATSRLQAKTEQESENLQEEAQGGE